MTLEDLVMSILLKPVFEVLEKEERLFKEWHEYYLVAPVETLRKFSLKKMIETAKNKEDIDKLLKENLSEEDINVLLPKVWCRQIWGLSTFKEVTDFYIQETKAKEHECVRDELGLRFVQSAKSKKDWEYVVSELMFTKEMDEALLMRVKNGVLDDLDLEIVYKICDKISTREGREQFRCLIK